MAEPPALGSLVGVSNNAPLYDRTRLSGTSTQLFSNYQTFENGEPKQFIIDTNLTGRQGGMPQATRTIVSGFSLSVNASDPDYRMFYEHGGVVFQLAPTRAFVWPARLLMPPLEQRRTGMHLILSVTRGEQFVLEPLESFSVTVAAREAPSAPVDIMGFIWGTTTRGICA